MTTESSDRALFDRRDDPDARHELVERYDGLVRGLAGRYRGRGEAWDDLLQAGRLGLIKAIDRFDASRDVTFATYATATVLGELKRHLRDKTWSVRVPRSVQERWLEVSAAVESLTQDLGRSPSIAEIAEAVDASTEDVLEAMDAGDAYTATSLDQPVGDESGSSRMVDLLSGDIGARLAVEDRVDLAARLEELPKRQRTILFLRFFEGMTQSEIGEVVGISQMHVSRLLRAALRDLRAGLNPS